MSSAIRLVPNCRLPKLSVDCTALRTRSKPDTAQIFVSARIHFIRPLICDSILAAAKEEGYSVAVDAPFASALVPLASYRKDRRILSVMIEVNRRIYMNEHSGLKKQNFKQVCAAVGRLIVTAA